jgi:hypothetical protein
MTAVEIVTAKRADARRAGGVRRLREADELAAGPKAGTERPVEVELGDLE